LFLIISLFLLLLFGLGWLVARHFPGLTGASFYEVLPTTIVCGLIMNYSIVLVLQSLQFATLAGILAAICGWWLFRKDRRGRTGFAGENLYLTMGAVFLLLLYLVAIVSEPLLEWDARSIWFFHAKMIYVAGGLSADAGWTHPSVAFAQVGYPKLVAVMAAQIMSQLQFWNEYIPKLSLFFLLVPPVFWIISYSARSWSFLFLVCVFPAAFHRIMWNGYMDGYLALYFSCSLLLLRRFWKWQKPADFAGFACSLFLLPNIKREGLLILVLTIVAVMIAARIFKYRAVTLLPCQWSVRCRILCCCRGFCR
jgi:hypothetical protein